MTCQVIILCDLTVNACQYAESSVIGHRQQRHFWHLQCWQFVAQRKLLSPRKSNNKTQINKENHQSEKKTLSQSSPTKMVQNNWINLVHRLRTQIVWTDYLVSNLRMLFLSDFFNVKLACEQFQSNFQFSEALHLIANYKIDMKYFIQDDAIFCVMCQL